MATGSSNGLLGRASSSRSGGSETFRPVVRIDSVSSDVKTLRMVAEARLPTEASHRFSSGLLARVDTDELHVLRAIFQLVHMLYDEDVHVIGRCCPTTLAFSGLLPSASEEQVRCSAGFGSVSPYSSSSFTG